MSRYTYTHTTYVYLSLIHTLCHRTPLWITSKFRTRHVFRNHCVTMCVCECESGQLKVNQSILWLYNERLNAKTQGSKLLTYTGLGILVDSEVVLSTRHGKIRGCLSTRPYQQRPIINKTLSTETSYQLGLIVGNLGEGMRCS
jgi:hypothetical protein